MGCVAGLRFDSVNDVIILTVPPGPPCHTTESTLTVHASKIQGVPDADWPVRRERPELPHLPEEETSRVLHVGSVSANTNTSAHLAYASIETEVPWLPNVLGAKAITLPAGEVRVEWSVVTLLNTNSNCRPHTKPLTARLTARARRGC